MRNGFVVSISLLLIVIGAYMVLGQGQTKDAGAQTPSVKWEYKIIKADYEADEATMNLKKTEASLSGLGALGWECVGSVVEKLSGGGTQSIVNLILKRRK